MLGRHKLLGIVAVDLEYNIGIGDSLLVSEPADLKLFRKETLGQIVVLGRKTFESIPSGLEGRTVIVMTSSKSPIYHDKNKDVYTANSLAHLELLLNALEPHAEPSKPHTYRKVLVCGGAVVYDLLAPYIDGWRITRFYPDLQRYSNDPALVTLTPATVDAIRQQPHHNAKLVVGRERYFDIVHTGVYV